MQVIDDRVGLQKFLKLLSEALSLYPMKELICALEDTVGNRKYDKDEIELIIQIVCSHYKVSSKALKNTKGKGIVKEAKHQCYCLMHFELKLPLRYISSKVFKSSHMTVYNGVKRYRELNPKLKLDKEFIDDYIALKEKYVTEKLKIQNTNI